MRTALADVLERYRIDPARAEAIVREEFARNRDLARYIGRHSSAASLERTAAFRQILVEARKRAYYELRRYKQDPERILSLSDRLANHPEQQLSLLSEIASKHVSTRERIACADEFHSRVFSLLGEVRTILDVGGGVHALLFPFFGAGAAVERYIVADRDPVSIHAVNAFASTRKDSRLTGVVWDISEGWQVLLDRVQICRFDAAFFLKLIPVVSRQQPHLLTTLLSTPADQWVLTASTMSMTKYQDISRRERALLKKFAAASDRQIRGEFSAGNELGIVLRARRSL